MLMDPRPSPRLPFYKHLARCGKCEREEVHLVEADHPTRGRLLVCGACAFLLGSFR